MRMFLRFLLAPALILGMVFPMARPAPVHAEVQYGYLWKLFFDFEHNFHGVLTIEVGPWENGNLVSVSETSTTRIACNPVGDVILDGGDAVFKGTGYVRCAMDLGEIVWKNHGLQIDEIDTYGSMVMRAKVNGAVAGSAPLFTHPDATYSLDFSQTQAATLTQDLWNGIGPMSAAFAGVTINAWHTHTYQYSCVPNGGPCDATFRVGPQIQNQPTAGTPVQFSTGPTAFEIGRDGATYFSGRIAALLVDPGNFGH
jgi:hypothetical protein